MPTACCCYMIDAGYLFPTFVSAMQARAAVPRDLADIKIFCIGEGGSTAALYRDLCASYDIDLVPMPARAIDDMPIMFGRFFLTRLLDPHYEAVVYLDGDTQISGSLVPLVGARLEPGRFLAARDPMSLMIDSPALEWRRRRAYFMSIGLRADDLPRYCNSGVLRFNLKDWDAISRTVLGMSAAHAHGLRFPDQDALNLAFGRDYLPMSYRWNFPTFLLGCGLHEMIGPVVYHFMSNPRPWHGAFRPWGEAWHAPYRRVVDAHPELRHFHRPLRHVRAFRYTVQQRLKALREPAIWSTRRIRDAIARQEAEAVV